MNKFGWHMWWFLFDIITLTILSYQWWHHRSIFGWWFLSLAAVTFMAYRTMYHGKKAWEMRWR